MTLQAAWADLSNALDPLAQLIRDFARTRAPLNASGQFTLPDECLLEGVLSRAWQAWSNFCRACVVKSCVGTVLSTGGIVTALPDASSEEHVSGAAIRANRRSSPPYWGQTNVILRVEPTWGDVDVLVKILTRLRPANVIQLLAAFSTSHASAKALQTIRNGAAHTNLQTLHAIDALRSAYVVFTIGHPTHAMLWLEPKSSDFLITHALQELKDAGSAAVT